MKKGRGKVRKPEFSFFTIVIDLLFTLKQGFLQLQIGIPTFLSTNQTVSQTRLDSLARGANWKGMFFDVYVVLRSSTAHFFFISRKEGEGKLEHPCLPIEVT